MRRVLTIAAILALAAGAASAQERLPENLSLTNAVEGHRFLTLKAAVDGGDAAAVLAMGGTASQGLEAILRRQRSLNPGIARTLERVGDLSDGAVLTVGSYRGEPAR